MPNPDQPCGPAQSADTNPVVVRNDSVVNIAPHRRCSADAGAAAISAPEAPVKCRRNNSAVTMQTRTAASASSGSRFRFAARSSPTRQASTRRLMDANRNSPINISPNMPDLVPSVPLTGEMPEVDSVAIAWLSATSDESPASNNATHSTSVAPP